MNQIKINYEYEVILSLLKEEKHGRALAKELGTSLTRIQGILNELSRSSIVDYKEIGRNHVYFIKKNLIAQTCIFNSEKYKLAKLISRYPFLNPLLSDIIEKSKAKLIILFGSYANETFNKESDIDIYIETTDEHVRREAEKINDLASIKIGKFNKDEILIKEIIKNHVILRGVEEYYEKLGFFKQA
jgi:predicted nucleotidyltransferase